MYKSHCTAAVTSAATSIAAPTLVDDGMLGFEDTPRGWLLVFYLVPREVTDAVLPLTITPEPAALVLIGRADVLGAPL